MGYLLQVNNVQRHANSLVDLASYMYKQTLNFYFVADNFATTW